MLPRFSTKRGLWCYHVAVLKGGYGATRSYGRRSQHGPRLRFYRAEAAGISLRALYRLSGTDMPCGAMRCIVLEGRMALCNGTDGLWCYQASAPY